MSRRTHYKVLRADYRSSCQTQENYDSQAACGYGDVTVTKDKSKVDCKLCRKEISKAEAIDGGEYDSAM